MNKPRQALYDNIIKTKGPGFSDLLKLLQDSKTSPSTLLMTPVIRLNDSSVVAIFTQLFSWDLFFKKSLPDYIKKMHVILQTKSKTFTIEVGNGQVTVLNVLADAHDTKYDKYRRKITPNLPSFFTSTVSGYQITIYPTSELYNKNITDLPRNVCIAVVFLIFFVVLVFGAYDYVVNRREQKLIAREERAVEQEEKVRDLLPHFLSPAEQHAGGVTSKTIADVLHLYPVHQAILERRSTADILAVLLKNVSSAKQRLDGRTAMDLALATETVKDDSRVILALLQNSLPFATTMAEEEEAVALPAEDHGYAWTKVVQHDRFESVVKSVLDEYAILATALCRARDGGEREAIDIASPKCKKLLLAAIYLLRRYEIQTHKQPLHESATCVVHMAIDHEDNGRKVAMKFMQHRDQFFREVSARERGAFEATYVVGVIRQHAADEDVVFADDLRSKGLHLHPFCIVMEMGDRSLNDILSKENIAGWDWDQIRFIILQIAKCVAHMHAKGYLHADIKPLNILRVDGVMKLIDLDASVPFKDNEGIAGLKYSSAYVPPEMIHVEGLIVCVKTPSNKAVDYETMVDVVETDQSDLDILEDSKKLNFELVRAAPSLDIWALGVVLYNLAARAPLLRSDYEGNIALESDMRALAEWNDRFKRENLSRIPERNCRHLVSLLLQKDPSKRPTIARVLAHPFMTQKKAARLQGEPAEFDVFLSYRVNSDFDHCEKVYNALTACGLKVWWDKKCLKAGEAWEEGFCDGLAKSKTFLPILSRLALKDPHGDRQNFQVLKHNSPCDNILLEYRMAMEMVERGLIEKIFPLFIGDKTSHGDYVKYDFGPNGSHPVCPDIVVASVEDKLKEKLEVLGMGMPYTDERSVRGIMADVLAYQGAFIEASFDTSLAAAVDVVKEMIKIRSRSGSAAPSTAGSNSDSRPASRRPSVSDGSLYVGRCPPSPTATAMTRAISASEIFAALGDVDDDA